VGGRVEACREGIHEVKDRRRAYYSLAEDLLAATRRWSNANQCAYIPFTCLHYVVVNIIQPVNKTIFSLFDSCESFKFSFLLDLPASPLSTARDLDNSFLHNFGEQGVGGKESSSRRKETRNLR